MPGDYSRDTFDPRRNYTAVRLQQGRVSLDADWNEQVDITQHQLRRQLVDLVGREGAPARAGGFGLVARNRLVFDGSGPAVAGPSLDLAVPGTRAFRLAVTVGESPSGEVVALASPEGPQVTLSIDDGKVTARRAAASCASEALDWSAPHALVARYDGAALVLEVDDAEVARVADDTRLHEDLAVQIEVEGHRIDVDVEEMGWRLEVGGTLSGSVLALGLEVADLDGRLETAGHWALEDGWGDRAADSSLCGHDLRLHGGPRWGVVSLVVTAGRYYVDGVMCENDRHRALDDQPLAPGVSTPTTPGLHLAYLELWERTVSAQEDPTLRDVALGGADTAVRTQAVARVRTLLLDPEPDPDRSDTAESHPAWTGLCARVETTGRMRARRSEDLLTEPLANQLYRVEIHHGGDLADATEPVWPRVPVRVTDQGLAGDALPADWVPGRWLAVEHEGTTTVVAVTAVADGAVAVAPAVKAATTARPVASLKWMTDNATQVFAVAEGSGTSVLLRAPVGHQGTELVPGDCVELSSRALDLQDAPLPLRRVTAVSEDGYRLTLDRPLPDGVDLSRAAMPLLRRWRQPSHGADTVPIGSDWVDLEHGVQVCFDGPVAAGQAWLVPTRTSTRQVHWPGGPEDPSPEPPREGARRLARLALLWIGGGVQVDDLRPLFPPLGEPLAEDVPEDDESVVVVPDRLVVAGDAEIEGTLRARRLRGRLGEATVDTPQLVDGAVTAEKLALTAVGLRHLADEVGVVPDGYAVLGASVRPPRGYRYTHQQVELVNHAPEWRGRPPLSGSPGGRAAVAVIDERAYALLQDGSLWCLAPEAAGWVETGKLPRPRRDVAVAALDGKLHCVGGVDARGLVVADHDVFDPQSGAFETGPPLEVARSDLALVEVDRVLYALGGMRGWMPWRIRDSLARVLGPALFRPHRSTRVVEALVPGRSAWVRCPPMRHGRAGMGVAALHGRIHLVGGQRKGLLGAGRPTGDHEGYVPAHGRWEERMPLHEPRADLGLAALQGALYAVGGQSAAGVVEDVVRYDLVTDTWHPSTPLPEERRHHGTAPWLGEVLVVGGWSQDGALPSAASCTVLDTLFVHQKLGAPAPARRRAPRSRARRRPRSPRA